MRRRPCASCPWWLDAPASDIPGFDLEKAEALISTISGRVGAPVFACHQSREGREHVCAGWLAVYGKDSIPIRLMLARGKIDPDALEPDPSWPPMHETFDDLITKLRGTT